MIFNVIVYQSTRYPPPFIRPGGVYFHLLAYTNKRRFKGMPTLAPAY